MADKFIPDADGEFATMAGIFANSIAKDPPRFMLSGDDAEQVGKSVCEYIEALSIATRAGTRTKLTIMQKDEVRANAERVIRRFANVIRANPDIDPIAKS